MLTATKSLNVETLFIQTSTRTQEPSRPNPTLGTREDVENEYTS